CSLHPPSLSSPPTLAILFLFPLPCSFHPLSSTLFSPSSSSLLSPCSLILFLSLSPCSLHLLPLSSPLLSHPLPPCLPRSLHPLPPSSSLFPPALSILFLYPLPCFLHHFPLSSPLPLLSIFTLFFSLSTLSRVHVYSSFTSFCVSFFPHSLSSFSPPLQESQIKRIYGTMINQKLQEFEEEVKPIGSVLTQATLELYYSIVARFLPTPAKIHYLFNLRDISRVFQGLLRAHRDFHDTKQSITRLWIHECFRYTALYPSL
uniref:Dynein heavy chain 3 AAA+ lid domain-containing protein n=1 Tax=Hucho hucho TaxID=62062 RepID=A0A4W5LFA3_9TELE